MDPPLKPTRRVRVVRVRVGVRPLKPTRRVGSRAKAAQDVGVDERKARKSSGSALLLRRGMPW